MLYPITQCYTLSHHVVQCKTIFSWQYVHEIIIQARITNMYNETNWCMVGSYDRFNNHWGVYPQWDLINIENNSGNHMQWVYDQQLPIMGLYVYIYIYMFIATVATIGPFKNRQLCHPFRNRVSYGKKRGTSFTWPRRRGLQG